MINPNIVWMVSALGAIAVFGFAMLYIYKKNWPGIGTFTRLSRIITFHRD